MFYKKKLSLLPRRMSFFLRAHTTRKVKTKSRKTKNGRLQKKKKPEPPSIKIGHVEWEISHTWTFKKIKKNDALNAVDCVYLFPCV